MAFDFIVTERFTEIESFAFRDPPTWTRLEPQTKTGDPRPGIEARVHDPLWMIGRQWQLGELEGEDAGTPLTVRAVTTTTPVDRWAATAGGDSQRLVHHDLLEPAVEGEPAIDPPRPGLRARAEAGSAFLAALADGGLAGTAAYSAAAVADDRHLSLDPDDHPTDGDFFSLDPDWQRLQRLLPNRPLADGESIFRSLEESGDALPDWLVPVDVADESTLLEVTQEWSKWYRDEIAPQPLTPDAWVGDRLEYQFRIAAGDVAFDAPSHLGGEVGWSTFDALPDVNLADPPPGSPGADAAERQVHAVLASPLRFPGMPADRLWELEDAQVNLGLIESEPWDLARLLVAEFALTYGNDWLVVPVDVPYGTLARVESVYYVTTFGERFRIRPTEQTGVVPDGDWRMFAMTTGEGETVDGLLIPPGAIAVQDGPPIEEVLFLRDEMANVAWAVERSVQAPSGSARERSRERDGVNPPTLRTVQDAELDYTLQTLVPARWIPYLPRTKGYRAIELVQGRMPDAEGNPVEPIGVLLTVGGVRAINDAEIPREGIAVRRLPSVARRADGTYARWLTRRISVGRGEGASQLHFDAAPSRAHKPNTKDPRG